MDNFSFMKKPNLALVLLLFMSAVLISELLMLFNQKRQESSQRRLLQNTLSQTQAQLEQQKQQNKQLLKEKTALTSNLKDLKNRNSEMARKDYPSVKDQSVVEKKIREMQGLLKKRSAQLKDAQSQIQIISREKVALMEKSKEKKKEWENKLSFYHEIAVSWLRTIVQKRKSRTGKDIIEGFIWKLELEYNLANISPGKIGGIKKGIILDVFSQDNPQKKVGKIKVISIQEISSVAEIIEGAKKIKKGDVVKVHVGAVIDEKEKK